MESKSKKMLHALWAAFQRTKNRGAFFAGLILLFPACAHTPGERVLSEKPEPMVPNREIYRLRVGDIIQIDVFQEPIMTSRQRVLGDGTISVNLVGRLKVLGNTVEEAANKIAARLNEKQLVNPQVTVTVLAYSPRRFTVWGQVKTAGNYVIPPEEKIYLPEVIAMAGGNTTIGDVKRILVTRRNGAEVERIRINAYKDSAQSFEVKEGDIVFIPETIF